MITILRNLWVSREARKNELSAKLEEEQRKLDLEIDKENISNNAEPISCMKNVIQTSNAETEKEASENSKCFKRTGLLSSEVHLPFDPDKNCVFSSLNQEKVVEFICNNNYDRIFRAHIEVFSRNGKSQLCLIDPEPGVCFDLGAHEKRSIRFKVESKYYGESNEQFVIQFETFRIKRSILIIVCETDGAAEAIQRNMAIEESVDNNLNTYVLGSRNQTYRSRQYANQIWSNRKEVVPGVAVGPKRRFVANRIGYFEVPERLRKIYLTSENKQDMHENIEQMFPSIKEDLSMLNYTARFQTLIYLEEIECFVNFRNFDRERAHFTRDGEYLSLTIENLSERRPSLVLGDIVRAINPWSDRDSDKRCYDGVIHKVLFNRVLMKFNAGFQQKYNGIITDLKSNHGTIDHGIFFDINVALAVATELKIGCRVEYLAYKHQETDHIKVVKIDQVIDQYWDEEAPSEQKIDAKIKELKTEKPTFFNTHQRNILGLIIERKPDSIIVDTDYKTLNIHLDSVEIDFVPKEGDRVYVCCNVQSDENFVDRNGEVLEEVSVHPSRLMKNEKCTVKRLHADWGVLNQDTYFTFDVLPSACNLNVGDIVNADIIECERGKYVWRCIKLTVLDKIYDKSPLQLEGRIENRAITVDPDKNCVFSSLNQEKVVEFICNNNYDRIFRAHIEVFSRNGKSQLCLIDPEPGVCFDLGAHEKRSIRFKVESKYYGESNEQFVIQFETFRIKRSILIIVCETDGAAEAIQRNMAIEESVDNNLNTPVLGSRNQTYRSRHYANQIWSNRREVVPGVAVGPKRRFVANRIGYFEVPERLRKMYLTSENKQDMHENIEQMFPSIKEDLSMLNYTARFQTLIYLEEIECFVNFRNFDRERAHFTRDGEYLSLTIENLSERRPSLVLGDIVRAINPWSDRDSDKRCYDGVIHKVLFNRVLMKFNAGFQQKYNGEDYRLEFYFSRFGFRKQHFAVGKVVKHLGEKFLFPSNIYLREQPQLDIQLNAENNMILQGTNCKWYNKTLNPIQKVAVFKILRGETENMPYVIFGPPGTGKTITLVETILQLVKRLPGSRLLVGTPSNSSADLITTRLIESGDLCPGDFIRLVSQNQIEKELVPEHLMPYCATVDIAADGTCNDSMIITESGLKLKCQMKYLGRHRVTISTCSTLGNFLQMDFPRGHFTHVLIDESGQCSEPEIMVAITQVSQNRGQVILAGDPNQLQAIITNRYAGEKGLGTSFLERILSRSPYLKDAIRYPQTCGYDPRLLTKLLYSYRALPSILYMYNKLFYDSELKAMIDENNSRESQMIIQIRDLLPESKKRSKTHGLFFYGMLSENMQEKDSPSWYNPHEAKNVFLMTLQLYRKNIRPENIGIITPYSKQVKHLRALFITADIAMPKIGSVEEFQGQERDIILISTVRSTQKYVPNDIRHSLGFVNCAKRINVAISRSRYLLYIFGNPYLLVLDPCWRSLIKYCVDNDAYLGCDLPPEMYEPQNACNLEDN